MSVGVNPPKTPITKGSNGIAQASLPNTCKMPGPPAPFVPTPLPNIGKSGNSPEGYTTTVKVEGNPVAVRGASFGSIGDVASKGTGGGLVSANTQGPCKFVGPGSMDVKFEGKNVQLLGDPVTNNGGSSGSPANSATMMGTTQRDATNVDVDTTCVHCGKPLSDKSHQKLRTDDPRLVDAANDKTKNKTQRHGHVVGAMQVGQAEPTYATSGPPVVELFNLKTKRKIPLSTDEADALEDAGFTVGNCAEQKLLYNEFIANQAAFPPAEKLKMGIANKLTRARTEKDRKGAHKAKCGTCERVLVAMLCTNEPRKTGR